MRMLVVSRRTVSQGAAKRCRTLILLQRTTQLLRQMALWKRSGIGSSASYAFTHSCMLI